MTYGLEINNLSLDFGAFKIENLNLNVRKGCITGLIGRNGAGKSTLIKMITRQQDADSGLILYNGEKFADNEAGILNNIACVFDSPHFSIMAKPKKILKIYKKIFKNFDTDRYYALMDKFKLPHEERISNFSFGMQRKYCIILALCRNADILILDEPTSGIDPFDRSEVVSLIQDYMMDENHTVLFSTHITEDLDKIADYVVMMDDGKITMDEDKITLTERYRLVQCENLTPDMECSAIGIQKSLFGYTFLTQDKNISGEGIKVKVPTIEEMFVHLLGENAAQNPTNYSAAENNDIFKV